MKVNILNGWEVGMVDVPEGAIHIHVEDLRDNEFKLFYKSGGEWFRVELPDYFQVLGPGTASQVSEEEAKGIVDYNDNGIRVWYKDYELPFDGDVFLCQTSVQSLHSYIRANGKEPERCVILVKNKS